MSYRMTEEATSGQMVISNHSEGLCERDISGEHHTAALTTSGKTGEENIRLSELRKHRDAGKEQASAGSSRVIRILFDNCSHALKLALQDDCDIVEQGNAFFIVLDGLKSLWKLRKNREHQFAQLVNMLQTLLLETDREDYDSKQIKSIKQVLDSAALRRPILDKDIKEYVSILDKAGLDIFRGLR